MPIRSRGMLESTMPASLMAWFARYRVSLVALDMVRKSWGGMPKSLREMSTFWNAPTLQ